MEKKLSLSGKLKRLSERLRTPEWRKYGQVLMLGKVLGVALVFMLAIFMHPEMIGFGAHAQAPAADPVLPTPTTIRPIHRPSCVVSQSSMSPPGFHSAVAPGRPPTHLMPMSAAERRRSASCAP